MSKSTCLLLFVTLFIAGFSWADNRMCDEESITAIVQNLNSVAEPFEFYGLASYYNHINYYHIGGEGLQPIDGGEVFELSRNQWLASVGRFKVVAIMAEGLSACLDGSRLIVANPQKLNSPGSKVLSAIKPELSATSLALDQIRYVHLWKPLAWLSKLAESALVVIQKNVVENWGLAIIAFSVALKLLLLPVGIMTVHFQRHVSIVQAQLAPRLARIKASCDGEEAHNELMAAHKELGVSPFYTLKPMLGSLIQVPILIAVFNALGEMPQLDGQSFLWIDNLAYPDAIAHIPFAIPMFGDTISLLPFIMTVVTLYSTAIFQNRHAPKTEVKGQKRNLYLMAAAFFVLFYPFPAAMVLYWAMANILQTIQQQLIKI